MYIHEMTRLCFWFFIFKTLPNSPLFCPEKYCSLWGENENHLIAQVL